MSVGTEIRYGDTMAPDHGWEEELSEGWDREAIVEEAAKLDLKFQVFFIRGSHLTVFQFWSFWCYMMFSLQVHALEFTWSIVIRG